MRSFPIGHIALLVLALSAFAHSASANERFMCADGTFVEVTNQNRAEQYKHPCVKAWFERRAERKKKPAPKADAARPDAVETTGSGAVQPAVATAVDASGAVSRPGMAGTVPVAPTQIAPK
jgi:hypothetical protein